jgi:hypothetical protein
MIKTLRTLGAMALLTTGMVMGAGTAHADNSAYLRTLRSEGVNADDNTALALGMDVCKGVGSGMDDSEIVTLLRSQATINSDTAEIFLSTARLELC